MMQQSSRRPPNYPPPARPLANAAGAAPPRARPWQQASSADALRTPAVPPPQVRVSPQAAPRSAAVVVRPLGLQILSLVGILHASVLLMALVVVMVMAVGGDARVGLMINAIRQSSVLWTWTLFSLATSFVLGFVLLYNAIGTLSLTPWSDRTTKRWAVAWLALASGALVVNLVWTYPLLKEASPDRFAFGRLLLVTWAHIAAGVIWPGVVLFYMNTKVVKQAYARIAGGAATM